MGDAWPHEAMTITFTYGIPLYERMNIRGMQGLTEAQKTTLRALGATEAPASSSQ